jgi:hypothetical protein
MVFRRKASAAPHVGGLASSPAVAWLAHALIRYGCTVAMVPVKQVRTELMDPRAHAKFGIREIEKYLRQTDSGNT